MSVERIYPESKTALIKWIEDHFHEIDSFVCVLRRGEDVRTIYDVGSYIEAVGMLAMSMDSIQTLGREGELIVRREDKRK